MSEPEALVSPEQCAMLLVDFQAGLAFGVESSARQTLLSNAIALGRISQVFATPIVVSTSASRVYSGPLFPALQATIPNTVPIERRNMNAWEEEPVRNAIIATGRKRLIVAGLLTEACVSFPVLCALSEGFEVFVAADACGGLTPAGHDLALHRMEAAGAKLTSWIQILLERPTRLDAAGDICGRSSDCRGARGRIRDGSHLC